MDTSELIPVLKQVLTNPVAVGTAVVVILYMNFCCYVANYSKKPPKPKKKAQKAAAPASGGQTPAEGEKGAQTAGAPAAEDHAQPQ